MKTIITGLAFALLTTFYAVSSPFGTYQGIFIETGEVSYRGLVRATYSRSQIVTVTQIFPGGVKETEFRFYTAIGKILVSQYINGGIVSSGNGRYLARGSKIRFSASIRTIFNDFDGLRGSFFFSPNQRVVFGRFRTAFTYVSFRARK